jgi:myo-inositol-1(or 4)-monophosphatase
MSLDALVRTAERAVTETGEFLRSLAAHERGVASTEVDGREVKLHADRQAHERLSELLASSGVPVVSEEEKSSHGDRLDEVWVIDPLDGSYNFSRELGHSVVSCAYVVGGSPVFGALYDLVDASTYVGGRDHPSRRNGRTISCSSVARLDAAVLCTGFPARFAFREDGLVDPYFEFMARFAKVRMVGSAAHSLCLLARGAADCYAERSIMLWDIAAGIALAQGAGANVIMPERYDIGPLSVVVAAQSLAERVTQTVAESRAFARH